jgi:hypothetical protein
MVLDGWGREKKGGGTSSQGGCHAIDRLRRALSVNNTGTYFSA